MKAPQAHLVIDADTGEVVDESKPARMEKPKQRQSQSQRDAEVFARCIVELIRILGRY